MDDEFIVKCTKCSKHGLYALTDLRSPKQIEKLTGNVACTHCNGSIHVELKKCVMCNSTWSSYDKDPLIAKPNPFMSGVMIEIRTGSTCPVCNPQIRDNVLKHGQEFVRKGT